MTENEREQLREEIEAALRPAVDQVIDDAVRPWRRTVFWMGVGFAVLLAGSLVQLVVSTSPTSGSFAFWLWLVGAFFAGADVEALFGADIRRAARRAADWVGRRS